MKSRIFFIATITGFILGNSNIEVQDVLEVPELITDRPDKLDFMQSHLEVLGMKISKIFLMEDLLF